MIDEIREKFLPRFLDSARSRLRHAAAAISEGAQAAPAIAADLHTIAGEASIMGLAELAEIARESERAVRQVGGLDDATILAALDKLARGLDELDPARK
jgi:HPt (histidine-containing phosphotransfer) domain-containing protein